MVPMVSVIDRFIIVQCESHKLQLVVYITGMWSIVSPIQVCPFHINIPHIQIQELSNKAAARFDKANSQHMAAKEMIRMSESQLSNRSREGPDPSSPSPIDLAWQEMLNHATIKVRNTIYIHLYLLDCVFVVKNETFVLVFVRVRFCHCWLVTDCIVKAITTVQCM